MTRGPTRRRLGLAAVFALLLLPVSAQAQFVQQGPKLVGTAPGAQCSAGPFGVGLRRRQHRRRWSAQGQWFCWGVVGLYAKRRCLDPAGIETRRLRRRRRPKFNKVIPSRSPPTATRSSSAGSGTTATSGPRGSSRAAEASGASREGSWSALATWGTLDKAIPFRSRPTATPPSSEETSTTTARAQRGSGPGAEASGLSRETSWLALAERPTRIKAPPSPSPATVTRPSLEGADDGSRGRVGLDQDWRRLDPTGRQAGRHGRRGIQFSSRRVGGALLRRQHRHGRRNRRQRGVGATWVFTRSGSVWTQQGAKLVGTGAIGGSSQGHSVSLSSDGNTAIIGGSNDDNNAVGAVWIWTRSGSVWSQQGSKLVGTGAVGTQAGTRPLRVALRRRLHGRGRRSGDNSDVGATWVFVASGP